MVLRHPTTRIDLVRCSIANAPFRSRADRGLVLNRGGIDFDNNLISINALDHFVAMPWKMIVGIGRNEPVGREARCRIAAKAEAASRAPPHTLPASW
jgi:hypothetical protein